MSGADLPAAVRDVLLLTARPALDAVGVAQLRTVLAGEMDWTALVTAALAHGTAGLLCRQLLDCAGDIMPADIAEAARGYLAHLAARHAEGVAQLLGLLDAFAAAGIAAAPFKGPALAQVAYADPALRGFRDLDILIAEADVDATMTMLARRGYVSQYPDLRARHRRAYHHYNGQDILFAASGLPVEPHWQFGQRTLAATLDSAAMLRRRVDLPVGGRVVQALSTEDTLLAAGFHGSKEEWTSLRGIADIARLLQAAAGPKGDAAGCLDWDVLLARASAAGVRRMLLLGVALAAEMLAAPLAEPARRAIEADRAIPGLVAGIRGRLFAPGSAERSVFALSGFRWRMRERARDRLAYAFRTLTTARVAHFQAVDLPDRLAFLYPAVKLLHDYVALPLWLAGRSAAGRRAAPLE